MEAVQEKLKISPEDVFNQKLKELAEAATTSDTALLKEIQELAQAGERVTRLYSLSPAVCALLFLGKNQHNRDFSFDTAEEYARRMTKGLWKPNNATIGFYVDGEISDGQHRLGGAVIAGHTLVDYVVVFGMTREAIDTVDSPRMRDGASHAKLDGIQEAPAKQNVLKAFTAYMVKTGHNGFALRSASEIKTAIEENDRLLEASLRMGSESVKNRINPVFRPPQAANVAYIMLKNGWPEQRIREKLAFFQSGETTDGENSPFFVAGNVIEASRKARERRNRLTGVKELGVAIYAMVQTELGCKATKASTIKEEVKKTLPDPTYPAVAREQDAAA